MELLQKIGDREYRIEGAYKLADLNDELGTDLESEDYDSIGGYLLGLLGHFPQEGEEAEDADGRRLITEKVHRNRIEKVRLILPKGARPLPGEERADASCLERGEETP